MEDALKMIGLESIGRENLCTRTKSRSSKLKRDGAFDVSGKAVHLPIGEVIRLLVSLAFAGHVVVPIDVCAVGIVSPCPHVQFEE